MRDPEQPTERPAGDARDLRLRPGVHVVRRDDQHLQVGVDRHRAVVLPDRPAVRHALAELRGSTQERIAEPGAPEDWTRRRLERAGLLVDRAVLERDRRAHGAGVADLVHARHGATATDRLAGRAAARVDVLSVVEDPGGRVDPARELAAGLGANGVQARQRGPGWVDDVEADDPGPRLVVLVSVSPLRRRVVDPLVRAGLPHLVVAGEGIGVRVGPFVVPGATACLRCVDAHESVTDPRWGLVREQVAAGDRHPPPSALDWRAAVAVAAGDALRWVDGDRPLTWSATIGLGPDPRLAARPWDRHPHCGCAWDELTAPPAGG